VDEEWRLRVSLAPFYSSQYQYEPFDWRWMVGLIGPTWAFQLIIFLFIFSFRSTIVK
jgi:hypothetical protein